MAEQPKVAAVSDSRLQDDGRSQIELGNRLLRFEQERQASAAEGEASEQVEQSSIFKMPEYLVKGAVG